MPRSSPNTNVPATRRSIVLVLPHAIGTSRHGVPHSQGHGAFDVAGILHAFADAIADQQQVSALGKQQRTRDVQAMSDEETMDRRKPVPSLLTHPGLEDLGLAALLRQILEITHDRIAPPE